MVAYPPLNATCPQTDFENYAQIVAHIGSKEWFNAVFRLGFCGARSVPVFKEVLDALNKLAASNNFNVDYFSERSVIVGALERIGKDAKDAVPELITILDDEKLDKFLRWRAADALGEIGLEAKSAIPGLHKLLKSLEDSDSAVQVTKALGRIGEIEFAVSRLLETIKTTTTVRLGEKAALALAEIVPDTSGITDSLVEILQQNRKSNESRVSAALALSAIGVKSEDTNSRLTEIIANEQNSFVLISTALALLTSDGNKTAIVSAIEKSIHNLFNESIEWTYYNGGDPVGELQLTITRAVRQEMSVSVQKFINLLIDKKNNPLMRGKVIEILGAIGTEASNAVPELIKVVKNKSEDITLRQKAISALGAIGTGKKAVDELVHVVEDEQEEFYFRRDAVTALGEMGTAAKPTIPVLYRVLVESLVAREPNTGDSCDFTPKGFKIAVFKTLGKLGEIKLTSTYLLKAIEDNREIDDPSWRSHKLNSIRGAGNSFQEIGLPAVPFLISALMDLEPQKRRAAAYGLAMIGQLPNETLNPLIAVMNNESEDLDVRRLAAYALENSGVDVQEFFNQTNLAPASKAVCPDESDFFDIYLGLCMGTPKNGGPALFEWIKKKLGG
ncbi:HEAT repeat domain-containing protein [Microcoleus asticus]|uniref:Uncharacterized protein n=1 Tax=Microcoleus asticus IPMA8 TaxID=2563858 RepID=A0ABX2D2G2_9CYAN|nr:HEAT repeat domain-containing protein [Microcoleus asticus]NQE36834.1 hypothetical protein [Microcoleus asticus IPMA8]